IVQFPGVFIELLAMAEMERIPPARPRMLSFGASTRDFLAKGEGLSMLVLEGKGAAADAEAFRAAGIGDFDVFDFEREARRPDGCVARDAAGSDPVCSWRLRRCPSGAWRICFRAAGQADRGATRRPRRHTRVRASRPMTRLQSFPIG